MLIFWHLALILLALSFSTLQETLKIRFGCQWACSHRKAFDLSLFHNLIRNCQKCARDLFRKCFLALRDIGELDGKEGGGDAKPSEKSLILCIL